ncbi:DUF5362 family protein [Adhaeribacter rhizoryzae]|uniref:DUF5362 domain-containing protein n=1 Tax=Adhaeribacter rhizoryzae TaxID=2607907 RepID=A0A5M6D6G8_9BACT|nr:DUF5362 family protein [Adhaeribacter rhizoryzae]KAA5542943.1 hypothetical protein F0145_17540 [Adhaeribacter rhizoryzae]
METENPYSPGAYNAGPNALIINSEMKNHLLATAQWGRFLAIAGFLLIGLMVVGAFTIGKIMTTMMTTMVNADDSGPFNYGRMGIIPTIYLLLIALLYFFPTFYLYQFSSRIKSALYHNQEVDLAFAFSRLKSFFKFWGILFIIILGFYAFGFIAMLIGFMVAR